MKNYFVIFLGIILYCVSCENHEQENFSQKNSSAPASNVIVGSDWTLSQFSDSLDDNMTTEGVMKLFGDEPTIIIDDEFKELIYEVDTKDIYEKGVRLTTITFIFEKNTLLDVHFSFSAYFD